MVAQVRVRMGMMLKWMMMVATDSSYYNVLALTFMAVEVFLLIFIVTFVPCKHIGSHPGFPADNIGYRHRN